MHFPGRKFLPSLVCAFGNQSLETAHVDYMSIMISAIVSYSLTLRYDLTSINNP